MGISVKLDWANESIKCDSQSIQKSTNGVDWNDEVTGLDISDLTYTFDQTAPTTRKMYYRIGSKYAGQTKYSDPIELMVTGTDDLVVAPTNVAGEVIVE